MNDGMQPSRLDAGVAFLLQSCPRDEWSLPKA